MLTLSIQDMRKIVCICMDGRVLKAMVILKRLVNVPKCEVPKNVCLFVSKGGSMSEQLMLNWVDSVFKSRGNFLATTPSLLLMDSHKSHNTDIVIKALKALNVATKIIPPKTTPHLQPLDVSGGVNGPFKAKLREEWQDWLVNGKKEYTPAGNRKKPSYEKILQMVSNAVTSIHESTITRSFK